MTASLYTGIVLRETRAALKRNIVSIRESQNLFDDLSAEPAAWDQAIALELSVKPHLFRSNQPIIDRPFEEARWNEAIAYPFKHWSRTRFSDGTFGVWYGADSLETTIYETVHHWRHGLLEDAGITKIGMVGERKVVDVQCDALLLDFCPKAKSYPDLMHPTAYTLTQQVGALLHCQGHPGLWNKSARAAGQVAAILNPAVLSEPRMVCALTYTMTAEGVAVEMQPGTVLMKI